MMVLIDGNIINTSLMLYATPDKKDPSRSQVYFVNGGYGNAAYGTQTYIELDRSINHLFTTLENIKS